MNHFCTHQGFVMQMQQHMRCLLTCYLQVMSCCCSQALLITEWVKSGMWLSPSLADVLDVQCLSDQVTSVFCAARAVHVHLLAALCEMLYVPSCSSSPMCSRWQAFPSNLSFPVFDGLLPDAVHCSPSGRHMPIASQNFYHCSHTQSLAQASTAAHHLCSVDMSFLSHLEVHQLNGFFAAEHPVICYVLWNDCER